MTYLLIKHKVNDYQNWKMVFDDFVDYRKVGGEKDYKIFHPKGEPNNLILLFQWENAETAREFIESRSLQHAMEQAGVSEPPEIQYLEMIDAGMV